MRLILVLSLLSITMTACVSSQRKEEGKVTCLMSNMKYRGVDDLGTVCREKADPVNERAYDYND